MFSFLHTAFFFLIALAILIAFHEYGHYWVARRLGVKVIRFSLGFGKPLWRYKKTPDETEFVVAAIPLGGYVKMVDEREGEVLPADLPYAFNRQSVARRAGIVFAGPLFNLLLAIGIYWIIFMIGETGLRPVLGTVTEGTLAAQSGLREGDEILQVDDKTTPTWGIAYNALIERAVDGEESIPLTVLSDAGFSRTVSFVIPENTSKKPELLYLAMGLTPQEPRLIPVVDQVELGSVAALAGLQPGDRIVSANGTDIATWKQWVNFVRIRAGKTIEVVVERHGTLFPLSMTPVSVNTPEGAVGRIGAAVRVPEEVIKAMQVEYRLGFFPALIAAIEKTTDYSGLTLRMMGRMLIGKAEVDNLSGPISIAQYAGQSASLGVGQFMKFLALVSISLGVLNLLPIPVLDGGHLLFYLVEAVKGRPIPDKIQATCQQVGIFLLLCLMVLAFILDIERFFT